MTPTRRGLLAAPALILPAAAQEFPGAQPIRIVVPFPPGTPPDVLCRMLAQRWGEAEGWRAVVDNRPGAIGTVGAAEVLRQPADGLTLMAVTTPQAAAAALLPDTRQDLLRDFTPVARLSRGYNVLVVNPAVPARSLAELTALIRASPDRLNFPSPGYGTPAHLIGELYLSRAQIRATHVPYQQFPQAIAELLNGTSQFMFVTTLPVLEHIAAGRLRALAVTAPRRLPSLPDVPTVAEAGLPGLELEDWVGLVARSGTPPALVERLHAATERALAAPAIIEGFQRLGVEPVPGSSAAFGAFMARTVQTWTEVIQERGIRVPR
jgi:tripartite-type tricarboxylate transporter receptor subunit TctC